MLTVNLNQAGIEKILEYFKGPLKAGHEYFSMLGAEMQQNTDFTFRLEGARSTHPAWKPFSPATLRTPLGTWRLRYVQKPKRKAEELAKYKTEHGYWYRPGPMPGYQGDVRYASNSKLLFNSGDFFRSFGRKSLSDTEVSYGTNDEKAKKIMRLGREVLFVTEQDKKIWGQKFINFYRSKLNG